MRFTRFFVFVTVALALVSCSRDPKKVRQQNLESGNRYFDRGKYKEASIMYRNSVRADPKFGPAYYHLALVELKLQRISNAVAPLRRAIELLPPDSPDYVDANVKYAEIMLLAAQAPDSPGTAKALDEVRGIKDMLLKKDPNSFEGTKLLGELTLNDAMALYRKGKTQEFKEKMEEAIGDYRKALAKKPGDAATLLALGKTLMLYGEMDEAEQIYRQVIDKDKTLLAPYNELYKLYIAKRKLPEAENILKRAIGRVHVSINRTWSNQIDGNFPRAQLTCETAREAFQRRLGRGIDRDPRERHSQTRIAAGTDDATSVGDVFQRCLGDQKDAVNIDVQLKINLLKWLRGEITCEKDTGIIDQNIKAAELSDSLFDGSHRGCYARGIGMDGDRISTHGADLGNESFRFLDRLLIGDRNVGTILGQF